MGWRGEEAWVVRYEMTSRLSLFPQLGRFPGRLPGSEFRRFLRRLFGNGLAGGPLFGGGLLPGGLLFGFCAGWFGGGSRGYRFRDFRDDLDDGPFGRMGGARLGFAPAVSLADGEHSGEDVIPGLLVHQDRVGEHTTVPANVADGLGQVPARVAEPEAGVVGDVEFAVGVGGEAMAAGLVVRAGAADGGIVLRDMEINRPRAQRGGK